MSTLPAAADAEAHSPGGSTLRIQILGPLRLWRGGVELDTGPRQQAYLLALLLAHQGLPVTKTELVDLIWGDSAPDSAVNVIHKYVGTLRRLMEPALPARGRSSYLVRRGAGYLCTAGAGTLDLATFRELVGSARALGRDRHGEALDLYERALRLWHGSAGDGLACSPEAMPVFAGLNGEFFDACTAAAEVAVSLGTPDRVLAPLRLAASIGPLHEPVQAGLVTALGAAGRQAEALSVFQTVRVRLAEELGIDPGALLGRAYEQVLRQEVAVAPGPQATPGLNLNPGPHLNPSPRPSQDPSPNPSPSPSPYAGPGPAAPPVPAVVAGPAVLPAGGLVGRTEERAVLRDVSLRAAAGGSGLAVVEGEPGVGKTRLLEEAAEEAGERGTLVAWGRCVEGQGAPSMWPWVQVVSALLDVEAVQDRAAWLRTGIGRLLEPEDDALGGQVLPGGSGQFRLFENVVGLVAGVAARRPVMIVVDDLQWADVASLDLVGHLAARLPPGTVVLGALRDHAPTPGSQLARMLAGVSRSSGHRRLQLGPLGGADVTELVRREIGHDPDPRAARAIHRRTAGNPFYVRELARMLARGGLDGAAAGGTGVPSTVRDVVRDRMADLDDQARSLLEIAALIGRDVDLVLLARVADVDVDTCLTSLEPVEALGLLAPAPGDPYSVRFVHDLVRESVSETTSPRHATRLHLRVADALEQTVPDGESVPERVAHHLWAAGPLAEPARTSAALVRSGRRAAAKSALEAAEQQLRLAAQVARTAGLPGSELAALSELIAVVGMRSMYAGAELELLERAEDLARGLGLEAEAAGLLYSRWAAHIQGLDLDRSCLLAQQMLELGKSSPDPVVRAYGPQAWGIHQYHVGSIGEAFDYLRRSEEFLLTGSGDGGGNPVQHDLELLTTGMLAETTAVHGDVAGARELLDRLESAGDDRYTVTVWATMCTRIAVVAGDSAWALSAARQGIAVDPDFSYTFLGTYQRLARCWGRAATGDDPAGAAAEAERLIGANLLDPVRSGVSTWHALLGDMWLAAGEVERAAAAMDRADGYLRAHGQRYSEGLLLLLRARLLRAQGQPDDVVRAAVQQARGVAARQEAGLFVRRADQFLAELDHPSSVR
ncbi:BTAD domain-containing putative transcriptional regulator [Promicromonospora sp. NPDC059942]|uniref:BTAD domain-containing putative transcriptional regulator n=1 Tax=Promicromonospora sp. NPDC059942 TaxID=3347009 RepID=UPI00365741A0